MNNQKTPFLKTISLTLLVLVLMLGSGYFGAHLALIHNPIFEDERQSASVNCCIEDTSSNFSGLSSGISFVNDAALLNLPQANRYMTLPDLFDATNPAVVAISTQVRGQNAFGQQVTRPASGSGFFISSNGYILTNDHVIEGASSITVLLYDGRELPATLVGSDSASDLAVIQVAGTGWSYLPLGNSDAIRVGEQVVAIGNPLGELANSMTVGHISGLDRDITIEGVTRSKIQTDAALNRGNSGGPLINLRGEVVGVVNAKSVGDNVEGLGFAIPANTAQRVAQQLIDYGFVRGRAVLGVTIANLSDRVQIATVIHGSAAYRAGLRAGDVILQANGVPMRVFADLRTLLDEMNPSDEMALRIRRNGSELTVTVILEEQQPAQM